MVKEEYIRLKKDFLYFWEKGFLMSKSGIQDVKTQILTIQKNYEKLIKRHKNLRHRCKI